MKIKTDDNTVLCIPDIHAPYHHPDTIGFIQEAEAAIQPDIILQLGDVTDQHTLGRWEKNPNLYGAKHEYDKACGLLEELYATFTPESKKVMLYSNHDIRAHKKAMRAGIPESMIKPYRDLILLPKEWDLVERYYGPTFEAVHGEAYCGINGARQAIYHERNNMVMGHAHSLAGVTYQANSDELCWAMHCGCLIDFTSPAFDYARHARAKPILGLGAVVSGVPYFIPMLTNKKNRWTGEIIL